ncbi:transposon Ty3-G Gag-Pol polyprotein [Elysia marginata]|uniref:Transposon Ty3-G Gag-Pol polyprotein n=1 Tax=Elysia marginata TaxID=1093978 RepID=A0AAV4F2P7_9GAST|nr:transposon Ty3-G Gag-Pol polyprotein [Elysia marginata]
MRALHHADLSSSHTIRRSLTIDPYCVGQNRIQIHLNPMDRSEPLRYQAVLDIFRLVGVAASAISGLALTAENYLVAKDILKRRFGRRERIIFSHVQKLLESNWSNATGTTTASLWRLHDELQTRERSLDNLGISGKTYGVILTPLILHQLPPNVRLEWARIGEGHEGDLEFLLNFLFEEIQRRKRSQTFGHQRQGGSGAANVMRPGEGLSEKKKQGGTASALMVPAREERPKPLCVFCSGNHYYDRCQELKDLDFDSRKDKIKKLGLCYLCLGKHFAKECQKACYFCKGKHHSVLCKKQIEKRTSVKMNGKPALVSYARAGDKSTVMQVVRAVIDGNEFNVLFDCGSDRSFITVGCAKRMKLKCIGKETLTYCCFGENESRRGKKDEYEMSVGRERLRLIGMKTVCSTMYRAAVPVHILRKFSGLNLAGRL